MNEWMKLQSFDDWAAKLQTLLDEAEAATAGDDETRLRNAAANLRDFRRFSPPLADELDEVANRAIDGLVRATIEESLRVLNEASAELDGHVKRLREIATDSRSFAGWLSLRTPQQIVERVDETIGAIEALYETTKDFENAEEVQPRVDSVIRALKRLRDELGGE